MACDYCNYLNKEELLLFQDQQVMVVLHPEPAIKGHILIIPKEHHPILEQVSHDVVATMLHHANKATHLLLQEMQATGVSVLIQNGITAGQKIPHTAMEVIPRYQNDGLALAWQPQTLSEEELLEIETTLKEEAQHISINKPVEATAVQETPESIEEEENYLLKHLRRIP